MSETSITAPRARLRLALSILGAGCLLALIFVALNRDRIEESAVAIDGSLESASASNRSSSLVEQRPNNIDRPESTRRYADGGTNAASSSFFELLRDAKAGDRRAADTLFTMLRGCREVPLNAFEQAQKESRISKIEDANAAHAARRRNEYLLSSHKHCLQLTREQADQEIVVTKLVAELGNNAARVHFWLHGEPFGDAVDPLVQSTRAQFARDANRLLDAAVADGDIAAMLRREESLTTGRFVQPDPVKAFAYSYARALAEGGAAGADHMAVLELQSQHLSPRDLELARAAGEDLYEKCCGL